MQLAELAARLAGARVNASETVEITGITHDSRSVKPGNLFVCLVGEKFDGHRFAADALARGAAAFCATEIGATTIPASAPVIVVRDTRAALPTLAVALYNDPTRDMIAVATTGTNGKTTTTLLTASILKAAGYRTGTIGTLGAELMGEALPSERTTPEADQLQAILSKMRAHGGEAVVMEASSHALDQRRTEGCRFDAAVFTNLTQDHLDYHGSLDLYFEAKLKLFRDYPQQSGKPFVASINVDDPRGAAIVAATRGRAMTYAVHRDADVVGKGVRIDPGRLEFVAHTPIGELKVELPIGGAFQVYNALGAIGAAVGLGIEAGAIECGLAKAQPVPGRFESIPTGRDFHVVVDYAHTPDGLLNLLDAARNLKPSRIITVFGCGGDRDPTKRPIMGSLAASKSDLAIVTSDNPRTEDPHKIIDAILVGMSGATAKVLVEPDRREAIAIALDQASGGDLILIAGKGHEDYQEIDGVKYPFDDRVVVRELLHQSSELKLNG